MSICATAEEPPPPTIAPVAADTGSIQVVADIPTPLPQHKPEIVSVDTISAPTPTPADTPVPPPTLTPTPTATPLPTATATPIPTPKPESTDGRREGRANWDEGAYKGESLGSIGTDVTPRRVFSSRTGPRERSMEAGNRVIARPDATGCTRGPGGREFGCGGSVADSAVRLGVGWLAVGPGRGWPAQPRASPGEDAK